MTVMPGRVCRACAAANSGGREGVKMAPNIEWARLHGYDGERDVSDTDGRAEGLSAGWHLWAKKSHFPADFAPGFRYLITEENAAGERVTNKLAVVSDWLRFTDVVSLLDAYAKAERRFGPLLGVDINRSEWLAQPYNAARADRRLFTLWTYHTFDTDPVDVGDFSGTFTGWKRI